MAPPTNTVNGVLSIAWITSASFMRPHFHFHMHMSTLYVHVGPGGWNDLDFIMTGGQVQFTCHERSFTHCPSSQGWASSVLLFYLCCVCDFDGCVWVLVWGRCWKLPFFSFYSSFLWWCAMHIYIHIIG